LDWETDSECYLCYNGFLNDNHTFQFNTIYYVGVKTLMGDASYPNYAADAFMETYLNSTVRDGVKTYKYTVIITALAKTYCTSYCDTTADDWEDGATCTACYSPYYNGMNQAQKDATYYAAMYSLTGISNHAIVDAYVLNYVETIVYAAAADAVVNEAVATALCASDSGDRGYCNVSSAYWQTDEDCSSCYNGFLNGTMDVQADYIYYTAVRSSFADGVDSGVDTFKQTVIYTALAATYCTSYCDSSETDYLEDATCYACYSPYYAGMTDTQKDNVYYAAMYASTGLSSHAAVDLYAENYVRYVAYGSYTAPWSLTDDFIDDYVESAATATLEALVAGKTPYTFQIYSDPMGQARTSIDNSDDVLLSTASGTCYNWDEGLVLPEAYHIMTLGGTKPNSQDEVNTTNPYSRVRATQVRACFFFFKMCIYIFSPLFVRWLSMSSCSLTVTNPHLPCNRQSITF
jgi:hypothetical protein